MRQPTKKKKRNAERREFGKGEKGREVGFCFVLCFVLGFNLLLFSTKMSADFLCGFFF